MELWGSLEVLKFAMEKNFKNINLLYDFEGVKNYAYNNWYTNYAFIKNIYIPYINKLKSLININFIHISAHSGINGKDLADELAK